MSHLLASIERQGNRIPHPTLLFVYLAFGIIVVSALSYLLGIYALNPLTGEKIHSKSLISAEGLRFILTSVVPNFTSFAPLGIVLVAMLGIGIAEQSKMLDQLLLKLVQVAKGKGLTFIIAFSGVMSSMAADSGYVILVPIAALMFKAAGRPPIAGIATAFAAVSGGYSANLLIGPVDAILAGISTEAAHIVDPKVVVTASANWYFNIASTLVISLLVTVITEKRSWKAAKAYNTTPNDNNNIDNNDVPAIDGVTKDDYSFRGLIFYSVIFISLILVLVAPTSAPLRDPVSGSITASPFTSSIVILVSLYFAGSGLIFGYNNKVFNAPADIIAAMENSMRLLAPYLVMMFFAAQFIAYFNWSNLGLIIAIEGANTLQQLELPTALLLIAFIVVSAGINLFIGSASAKWALIAPVFIPMLMLVGIQPEMTQAAYRIGDSSTNIITPMMPYFALVLGFLQRHDSQAGVGTLMAAMLPYALAFLLLLSALLIVWITASIPLGI